MPLWLLAVTAPSPCAACCCLACDVPYRGTRCLFLLPLCSPPPRLHLLLSLGPCSHAVFLKKLAFVFFSVPPDPFGTLFYSPPCPFLFCPQSNNSFPLFFCVLFFFFSSRVLLFTGCLLWPLGSDPFLVFFFTTRGETFFPLTSIGSHVRMASVYTHPIGFLASLFHSPTC